MPPASSTFRPGEKGGLPRRRSSAPEIHLRQPRAPKRVVHLRAVVDVVAEHPLDGPATRVRPVTRPLGGGSSDPNDLEAGQLHMVVVPGRGKIVAMTTTDERSAYADFTDALVADFRANGGKVTSGPFLGRNLLLLHTVGARTGEDRLAPVVYTTDGDAIVIVASKGGAPTDPAWYLNILANPVVTVELGDETFQARATVTEGEQRDRLYATHAAQHPAFSEYPKRTTRVIPVLELSRIS